MAREFEGQTILITGASSGIGAEFARQLSEEKARLILVARRVDRLETLAVELRERDGIEVSCISSDLSQPEAVAELLQQLDDQQLEIDLLINNAGLGQVCTPRNAPLERMLQIVDVNVRALTELCYRMLPKMLKRGRGGIINVASVVSFQPVTYMATYAASKAFVLSLTESLAEETSGTNVRLMALCPGTTRTEFFDSAGAENWLDKFNGMNVDRVVKIGLDGWRKKRRVVVPGFQNWIMTGLPRFVPRHWLSKATHRLFRTTAKKSGKKHD